ncbi:MAG: MATE family efflux transporter [Erysipelotrichaceae bacterium]|nr:MATE family efflux transporter [Erysipelotrichaceae bacterium]
MKIREYIGDSAFFKTLLKIAVPMALANLLSSCMSIVDSVMVSSIGMVTAVGNAGNVIMLNDGILWGIVSGISIFTAQFYGAGQYENMSKCFGLSTGLVFLFSVFWTVVVGLKGEEILLFYLPDPEVVACSLIYLKIIVLSFFPAWFNFCVITMFRSMHETKFPFYVSTVNALLNILFNALFIYVFHMGIAGAALGTLAADTIISLFLIYVIKRERPVFYFGVKHMFHFSASFVKPIVLKTMPIVLNETLFGFGSSLFAKAYGLLGKNAMDAYYISQQAFNLFTFAIWGFGGAVSIILGSTLGSGDLEEAKRQSRYQIGAAFVLGSFLMVIMILFTKPFLLLYRIESTEVYSLTKGLMYVLSVKVFLRTFNYLLMSTLKAGGDSKILNLLDSGIMYGVGVTLSFASVYLGITSIVTVLAIAQAEQVVRLVFAVLRYRKGVWCKNLTTLVKE